MLTAHEAWNAMVSCRWNGRAMKADHCSIATGQRRLMVFSSLVTAHLPGQNPAIAALRARGGSDRDCPVRLQNRKRKR